jgi:S-adenosylmethionine hydrolase
MKKFEIPIVKSYNFVKPGSLLVTIGSSNYLEIALNQGDAAKKLLVKPDDQIKILFN